MGPEREVEAGVGLREAERALADVQPVGPVLTAGRLADAIVAALRRENKGVEVTDRGSYLRVTTQGTCRVSAAAVEAALGQPFHLPGDLECVMPSFRGTFRVTEAEAVWFAAKDAR